MENRAGKIGGTFWGEPWYVKNQTEVRDLLNLVGFQSRRLHKVIKYCAVRTEQHAAGRGGEEVAAERYEIPFAHSWSFTSSSHHSISPRCPRIVFAMLVSSCKCVCNQKKQSRSRQGLPINRYFPLLLARLDDWDRTAVAGEDPLTVTVAMRKRDVLWKSRVPR